MLFLTKTVWPLNNFIQLEDSPISVKTTKLACKLPFNLTLSPPSYDGRTNPLRTGDKNDIRWIWKVKEHDKKMAGHALKPTH